ncbi:uncharacterized protein LOC131330490 isoform X2 [Rhododendron vialii]|uniref:uncharacterized protein LOC131330490 isoform X2 n=1 Tax=Rhododendron vialii TaxID=182163 RepID=UPI00265F23A3|nr:uncharacterized protein LOC131330490 isoform X2 [Rhododendron vialii]
MKKMRWWWNWWRGKLTRTAMEKLKPWDAEEIRRRERLAHRKCHEELDKVDWEMMEKHLHTPEALQAYEKLCNEAREYVTERVTSVIHRRSRGSTRDGTGVHDSIVNQLRTKKVLSL